MNSSEVDARIAALESRIAALEKIVACLQSRDAVQREAEQGMVDILEAKGEGWKRL